MKLRQYFFAGLLIILPVFLTGYISYKIFNYIILLSDYVIPSQYYQSQISFFANIGSFFASLLGYAFSILSTLTIITVIGVFTVNYFGKMIIAIFEQVISKVPFARTIYTTAKQISELIFSSENSAYKKVVIVEYPYKGVKSIGFLTNDNITLLDKKYFTVFLPTAPNPTSGYLAFLEESQVEYVDITIEDAFKIVISGGAINPISCPNAIKSKDIHKDINLDNLS